MKRNMKKYFFILLLLGNTLLCGIDKEFDYMNFEYFSNLTNTRLDYYDSINWYGISEEDKNKVLNENYPLGAIVLYDYSIEDGLNILFTEASYFSAPAQIFLDIIYKGGFEDKLERFNKNIFAFWEQQSEKKSGRANLNLGIYYAEGLGVEQDFSVAEKYLTTAQKYGDFSESYYYLGYCYYYQNLKDKAEEIWKDGFDNTDYPNIECGHALGVYYQENQDYKKSLEYFNKVVSLDEYSISANINLGQIYIEGWGTDINLDKAIYHLSKVLKVDSNNNEKLMIYVNLAAAYMYKANNLGKDGEGYYNLAIGSYIEAARLGHVGIQDWLDGQKIDWRSNSNQ